MTRRKGVSAELIGPNPAVDELPYEDVRFAAGDRGGEDFAAKFYLGCIDRQP